MEAKQTYIIMMVLYGAAIVPKHYTELLSSYLGKRHSNDQGAVGIVLATRVLQPYQYVFNFWDVFF